MTRTFYDVGGMSCGGCATAVTKAILARLPDAAVSVDPDKGRVAVEGTAPIESVRAAVEDAGFDFRGVSGSSG